MRKHKEGYTWLDANITTPRQFLSSCHSPVNALQLQISQKHNAEDGAKEGAYLPTSKSKLASNANCW